MDQPLVTAAFMLAGLALVSVGVWVMETIWERIDPLRPRPSVPTWELYDPARKSPPERFL